MPDPMFDIFSGGPDKDPMWLDTVAGLSHARERMEQIAAKAPGHYFLFSTEAQTILAEIDTVKKSEPMRGARSAG
jgi:hypothetical protein